MTDMEQLLQNRIEVMQREIERLQELNQKQVELLTQARHKVALWVDRPGLWGALGKIDHVINLLQEESNESN